MTRWLFVFAVLGSIPAGEAVAQHAASIGFEVTSPRGEFDLNTDDGLGVAITYLYSPHPSRAVSFGATGTFQSYGSNERRTALSTTIPDILVDVNTSNNNAFLGGVLQLAAPLGPVKPYARGSAGVAWFFTTTSLEDTRFEETIISDTNQSDGTWMWTAGGGMLLRVWEGEPRPPAEEGGAVREPVRAYVDLGAHAMRGGTVEYLREGSLVTDEGEFVIDERLAESDIEAVQYVIGVTFEF